MSYPFMGLVYLFILLKEKTMVKNKIFVGIEGQVVTNTLYVCTKTFNQYKLLINNATGHAFNMEGKAIEIPLNDFISNDDFKGLPNSLIKQIKLSLKKNAEQLHILEKRLK